MLKQVESQRLRELAYLDKGYTLEAAIRAAMADVPVRA